MKICKICGKEIEDDAGFCKYCGAKQVEQIKVLFCSYCGTKTEGGNFCKNCGRSLVNKEEKVTPDFLDNQTFGFENINFDNDNIDNMLDRQIMQKELKNFDYEEYDDNEYIITGLKKKIMYNIVIPDCVIGIGDSAFENENIISVKLPETITMIGKRAFAGCKYLESINLPKSILRIDDEAFSGCKSLDITLPKVKIMGNNILVGTLAETKKNERAEQEEKARQEENAKIKEESKPKRKGNSVIFGTYKQNRKVEPIEWEIIEEKNGELLLLSKYILDCVIFDSISNNYENSQIRKWLNDTFLNSAFTKEEQEFILTSKVVTDVFNGGTKTTNDKIFLLSKSEAETYFKSNEKRQKNSKKHIKNLWVNDDNGYSVWWLRSPSKSYSDYANTIFSVGTTDNHTIVSYNRSGIVPALRIKASDLYSEKVK